MILWDRGVHLHADELQKGQSSVTDSVQFTHADFAHRNNIYYSLLLISLVKFCALNFRG